MQNQCKIQGTDEVHVTHAPKEANPGGLTKHNLSEIPHQPCYYTSGSKYHK